MSYISNEFLSFDPDFKGQHGDFTDNEVFTSNERLEFLRRYATYLKDGYSLPNESQYVVPMAQVREKLVEFGQNSGPFSTMKAYRCDMPQSFKKWNLYTKKAKVIGKRLILADADLPPNPSAEYALNQANRLKEIVFKFKMDGEYRVQINGTARDTTTARTVELRNGINDILKISFYSDGGCFVRHFMTDPYHSRFIKIGVFEFDTENTVKIVLNKTTCDICLNEQVVKDIPLCSELNPDTLFFCSGMFHFGDWEIEPVSICSDNCEITEFFIAETEKNADMEYIGEVTLPYAIGCQENRNKKLVLQKEFYLPDTKRAELNFDCLDPGGQVYIDGTLVAVTDGFDSFCVDLSRLSKNEKHLLSVVVFPRAPEVLFGWHRQKDPYNGWFCGEILLKCYNSIKFADLRVITDRVTNGRVKARFFGNVNNKCRVSVAISQCFGGTDPREKLGEFYADGDFEFSAEFDANAWDIDAPNLYNVYFTALTDGEFFEDFVETGFRTIEQKNGEIHLNGRRIDLKGALLMQFLPPYDKTSQSHICPSDEEVLWQEMMLKALGGNTLRLHILGYGSNDARYARYADRLGMLLIWTTRYIDTIEGVQWQGKWRAEKEFIRQIKIRINHPSIIMWEGSNELRPDIAQINFACDNFVPAIKSVDTTRLICPVSHLYYAGELYPTRGCEYPTTDGKFNHNGEVVEVSKYWTDPLVIRSAHTYSLLCGYGLGWVRLRTQPWGEQRVMLSSKDRAYIVSEYAVIGHQDPTTKEAVEDYYNPYSYEFPDLKVLGIDLSEFDWLSSQAHQALCAYHCTKQMRLLDVDGLLWCCLMGGANDGGYLKPIIDNYGYAKLGFYTMRAAFQEVCAFAEGVGVKIGGAFNFTPVLLGKEGEKYTVSVSITDECGKTLERFVFADVICRERITKLPAVKSSINCKGYYGIRFEIE